MSNIEIVKYIPLGDARKICGRQIFGRKDLFDLHYARRLLQGYRNFESDDEPLDGRFAHPEIFAFCVFADFIPEWMVIGNTIIPSPGNMSTEQRKNMIRFFRENRDRIMSKLFEELEKMEQLPSPV